MYFSPEPPRPTATPALPAVNLPAPGPEPEGWGSKLWNGTLALFDRALGAYGIREQRRTSVDLAMINAGVSIAQINGQPRMGVRNRLVLTHQAAQLPGNPHDFCFECRIIRRR